MTDSRAAAIVIGLGNPWRGDDGVGHAVADRIAAGLPAPGHHDVGVVLLDGEPARLLDAWTGTRVAVVVDAVRSDRPAGTVLLVEPEAESESEARAERSASSHGMGLAHAVALGRRLGRLPAEDLLVVGVVGQRFDLGDTLSPPVAAAVDAAATLVRSLVGLGPAPTVPHHGAVDARSLPPRRGGPPGPAG